MLGWRGIVGRDYNAGKPFRDNSTPANDGHYVSWDRHWLAKVRIADNSGFVHRFELCLAKTPAGSGINDIAALASTGVLL